MDRWMGEVSSGGSCGAELDRRRRTMLGGPERPLLRNVTEERRVYGRSSFTSSSYLVMEFGTRRSKIRGY
jgi:hypothetical protein